MDPVISSLLDELPEKPPRSKLEPHADVIAALRRKRHTYREIAEFFREHLSITVSPSTIHDFVRVRRGRGKRNVGSAPDEVPADPKALHRPKATENLSAADEAARQRIAAVKRRTPAEEPQPLFKYEEDEPLKLNRKPPSAKTD
jgi:IS30 family transposase